MIGKIWQWLDGKKTVIGAILVIVGTVGEQASILLPALFEPAQALEYIGYVKLVVGALHKVYKFIYKTDAPRG